MSDKVDSVVVENLEQARFECVFPTCGGICCQNGRPPVDPDEERRIEDNLAKFEPHLRPSARAVLAKRRFVTRRIKAGRPMLAVSEGWCIFHNDGCVLHKVGALEGDRFKYKPWRCVTFPLERITNDRWFVRQHGLHGEPWDLFCLDPAESSKSAAETLTAELRFVEQLFAPKHAREPVPRT